MGLTFKQERHNTNLGTSVSLSWAGNATSGSYMLAAVLWTSGAGSASVADTTNGSWTLIGGTTDTQVFQMPHNAATDTMSITATTPSSDYNALKVVEYTGQAAGNPLDGITAFGSSTTPTVTTPPLTTNASNETLICVGLGQPSGFTAGAGWAQRSPFDGTYMSVEDQNQTGSGTFTGTFNSSTGTAVGLLVAVESATSTFNISGNAGVAGATVSYSGTASGSVTADGSGNYTISGLANGSYTITPSLTGYTFSPTSASETVSGSNITGVNFTATQVQVATPTFSPVAGSYSSTQNVTISSTDSGLSGFAITYTTDGTTPVPGSHGTVYTTPVVVASSLTIKAVASATSYANSNEADAAYTISSATAYSVPDCRVTKPNSATGETINGTILYDSQTSSNPAIPPTDSRVSKPVACGTYPQNSRTPGTYGPGE